LPAFSSDPLRADRAQSASVLGNLNRGRFAAGTDDLWPTPLGNLTGPCLTVMRSETEPAGTLQRTAQRDAAPPAEM
jgi:hypothetical protein